MLISILEFKNFDKFFKKYIEFIFIFLSFYYLVAIIQRFNNISIKI